MYSVSCSCFTLRLPTISPCRDECGHVRKELSERHTQDSHAALAELASLKDAAMREAREEWERERRRLEGKVRAHAGGCY